LIYEKTGNLRAVQLLLGHAKLESTVWARASPPYKLAVTLLVAWIASTWLQSARRYDVPQLYSADTERRTGRRLPRMLCRTNLHRECDRHERYEHNRDGRHIAVQEVQFVCFHHGGIAAHPPVQFVPFRILLRRNAGRHANVSLERGHIDARIGRRIPSEGFAARQQVLDQIGLHMLLLAQIGP
jgi:hypothetical protein